MPVFIFFSFLLSVVIIPLVIYFCRRNGWYDFVDERKVHSGNIPRLGSIGFCFAFIITTVCYFMIYTRSYNNWVALSVAGFIIFIFGIVDDFKNLPAKIKLLVQILVAIILITEKLAEMCKDLIYELKNSDIKTLIVEIPDSKSTKRKKDAITQYIRDAVGIKI